MDFDNTIISYDRLIRATAMRMGLIDAAVPASKKAMRDTIRLLPDGENSWQKIQAEIYGPGIDGADLIEGVVDFLSRCRGRAIPLHVISHKTEYANFDSTKTNLRQAALGWMERRGLFEPSGGGLDRWQVNFAATRSEKIARIKALKCSHFIDDLVEVFDDSEFPEGVEKLLFDQSTGQSNLAAGTFASWHDISAHLLGPA
ncbi:MAG: hypothetical protein HOM52_02155 [Rhodospirillaceae bacterium]|nr:hypothetical protein [Rhodospirillaceae bacterium]